MPTKNQNETRFMSNSPNYLYGQSYNDNCVFNSAEPLPNKCSNLTRAMAWGSPTVMHSLLDSVHREIFIVCRI